MSAADLAALDAALALAPDNQRLALLSARRRLDAHRNAPDLVLVRQAYETAVRVAEHHPDNVDAIRLAQEAAVELGRIEDAMQWADQLDGAAHPASVEQPNEASAELRPGDHPDELPPLAPLPANLNRRPGLAEQRKRAISRRELRRALIFAACIGLPIMIQYIRSLLG